MDYISKLDINGVEYPIRDENALPKDNISQNTGNSETDVMSQKASSVLLTALTSGELLAENLIDTETAQIGMLEQNGTVATEGAYAFYFTSDFIKITPTVKYRFGYLSTDTPNRVVIREYNENKECEAGIPYYNADNVSAYEFTANNKAHYVRISWHKNCTPKFSSVYGAQVEKTSSVLEKTGLANDYQNLLNPESVMDGMIQSNDTILTNGAYGLYYTTTRIAVKPNERYVFRHEGENTNRLVWMEFGADLKPVGVYYNVDETNRIEYATGANTHYVQLSFYKGMSVMFALAKYADMFYPYGGVDINLIEMQGKLGDTNGNILKGKKYCACGDSFTVMGYTGNEGIPQSEYIYQDGKYKGWGITYPFIIGLRNDMEVVNLASGGMTMAAHDNSENVFSLTRYTQIPADADYITIKLGINDDNYKTPVGAIDDTDNTTFYGAYNLVLDYILRNHPFAKVGIIVTNGSAKQYTDATIAIARKWGIPYLDEVNDPNVPLLHRVDREGVSEQVKNLRLENFRVNETNTHPNTKAHYYEATFVEDFLRRL